MKKTILLVFLVVVFIGGFGLQYFALQSIRSILKVLSIGMMLNLSLIVFMFLKRCFSWYTSYMMNNKNTFVVKTDRPRVYIFSILFPILFAFFLSFIKVEIKSVNENYLTGLNSLTSLYLAILLSSFVFFSFLLYVALGKSFENFWLPKFKSTIDKINRDFNSDLSPEEAVLIFNRLVEYEFLEYLSLEEENLKRMRFVEIFAHSKLPETTIFNLNMDNIQTNYFFEKLACRLINFNLEIFLQIFNNKNIKASTKSIIASVGKSINKPKRYEQIEKIFSN